MFDKFKEECALVGVWQHPEAANMAYLSLYAQQHRGQEGAGVVSLDLNGEGSYKAHRGLGLVADVFHKFDFKKLPGTAAIGHVRYTTAGSGDIANVQPFYSEIAPGRVAIAHNGNIVNTKKLKKDLIRDGSIFNSTSDTEIFLHLLARSPKNVLPVESLIAALKQVQGAYSILVLFENVFFAARDPNGFRPLCIGKLDGSYIFASETCAFDLVGAEYLRDVQPGEVVEINAAGELKSFFPFGVRKPSPCIFEYVYFSRPDSSVFERDVYPIRKALGVELAKETAVEADVVIPVPDSGVPAALGYSQESGMPFEFGLIRNHYVGRTFIEPEQSIRDFGVKIKLNANEKIIKGKRLVVVDDSLVRGTTSKKLVKMLRAAGAKEVHLRISCPPTIDPCFYGIDTPQKTELIAATKSVPEIKEHLDVDSLSYLSMDGLYRAVGSARGTFCDACFSGNYPVDVTDISRSSKQMKLF